MLLLSVFLLGMGLHAQQDPMYTQYMFNSLSVNPAYAGSRDALSVLALYRNQWAGLEGAPKTATFTLHGPLYRKNMGLGLTLLNDGIGSTNQTMVFLDYSYMVHLSGATKLRFGLKGGFSIFQSRNGDLLNRESNDPTVFDYTGKLLPNIGVGIYYYGERGYLGLSMPKLLTNYVKGSNEVEIGRVKRHLFLMGGYVFDLSDRVKFKPSFLVKAVYGAPVGVDLSGIFYLYDKLGLGVAWRREDAISGLIHYYFNPSFYVGYAYDYIRTPLKDFSNGSHEFMLGYDFLLMSRDKIRSPRFF